MDAVVGKAAAGKLVEKGLAPLGKVVEYTFCYRSKVASLQAEVGGLENKLTDVKWLIEDAKRNGKEILQEPSNWVTDSQTALGEALVLKERSAHETCCWLFSIGDCNCKSRYDMAVKAVKLSEDMQKLMITARSFSDLAKRASPQRLPATYAHPYKALPSMEGYLYTLKGWLMGDQKLESIGVYGEKGAGKTLLVKKLAVELNSNGKVNCVVYVSAAMEYYSIQQGIAERVGLVLHQEDVHERAMWLSARLVEIGNVVFIIDDVEANGINLNHFGIPWSDQNNNGCRFVVVSTSFNTCKNMKTQKELGIEPLSKGESLHLFKELVNQSHGEGTSNTFHTGIDHISSRSTWLAGEIMEYYNQLFSPMDLKPKGIEFMTLKLEGSTPLKIQNEVWDALSRGESRIGIWGMGGVGKTSVVMHFNNEILSGRHDFKHVYFVTVSQGSSVLKLQEDISKALRIILPYRDETHRAAELHMQLKNREKSILILDDIWEDIPMEKVGVAAEGNGCKLLITTRKRDVCRKMNCSTTVEMKPLPENEAWDLFVSQLGGYELLSDEAKGVAKSIAKECSGLPLGIITVARCLRGELDDHVWRYMLRELQNVSTEQDEMEDKVFNILKLSYERLNNAKLQECFLYCALYPEDEMIERDQLIDRLIAGELIDESSREESIDKGHFLLNSLEAVSLLESAEKNDGKKCIKMHDLIRDMAIKIIGGKGMVKPRKGLKGIPRMDKWTKDLVQVSLMENKISKIDDEFCPECPNLAVLILCENPLKTVSESLFVHMEGLKILDLSYTLISKLPDSISNLCNLIVLLLRRCERLLAIPSLAELRKLKELDLYECSWIRELPSGFENLTSLERLNISGTKIQSIPDGTVYELSKLECFLSNNSILLSPKKLISLRQLWRLEGRIADCEAYNLLVSSDIFYQLNMYAFDVQRRQMYTVEVELLCSKVSLPINFNLKVDRRVKIVGGLRERVTEVPFHVPHNVQRLEVERCGWFGVKCLLDVGPSLCGATQLEQLYLYECAGIECIVSDAWFKRGGDEVSRPFTRLQSLRVSGLRDFVGLIEGEMVRPYFWFESLTELEIQGCPVLSNTSWLQNEYLPNLKSITLHGCGNIEELFVTEGARVECFPKLQVLKLHYLYGLKRIGRKGVPIFFPELRNLEVQGCRMLKRVGLQNHSFPSLIVIRIQECSKMEEIFERGDKGGEDVIHLPNLRQLQLLGVPKLRSICRKTIACDSIEKVLVWGESCRMKLENFPISMPRLLTLEPSSTNFNPPHPQLYGPCEKAGEWWNSLNWNDTRTQAIFNQLGCFRTCTYNLRIYNKSNVIHNIFPS